MKVYGRWGFGVPTGKMGVNRGKIRVDDGDYRNSRNSGAIDDVE